MMFNELERVVLDQDFPAHKLKAGDVGTIVMLHKAGKAYEVEFVAFNGETIAVVTATAEQLRPFRPGEIASVRSVDIPLAA